MPDPISGHILFVGDSEGRLTIWDGVFGTRIQQLQHHQADILQIAIDDQFNNVFCASVDNSITLYKRNNGKVRLSRSFYWQVLDLTLCLFNRAETLGYLRHKADHIHMIYYLLLHLLHTYSLEASILEFSSVNSPTL